MAILEVFRIFSLKYGTNWTNSREEDLWEDTVKMWEKDLERYSPSVLLAAASVVHITHPSFRPTVGEFAQLCKKVEWERRSPYGSFPSSVENEQFPSKGYIDFLRWALNFYGGTPEKRMRFESYKKIYEEKSGVNYCEAAWVRTKGGHSKLVSPPN